MISSHPFQEGGKRKEGWEFKQTRKRRTKKARKRVESNGKEQVAEKWTRL